MNQLITLDAASRLIKQGSPLCIAGPEITMDQLPAGNWIGGTTAYFMVESGGVVVPSGKVFVSDLAEIGAVRITSYAAEELANIAANAPEDGFSLTIIPAGGQVHKRFSEEAAGYKDAFLKPTVGWVAGVHLPDLGKADPQGVRRPHSPKIRGPGGRCLREPAPGETRLLGNRESVRTRHG